MKPTGRVSFISINFMSTRTLPKWLYRKRDREQEREGDKLGRRENGEKKKRME